MKDDYVKNVLEKDYSKFNSEVRSRLTKSLCTDSRIADYMNQKEKYAEMTKSIRQLKKNFVKE